MTTKTLLIVDDSRLSRMMIKSFCLASKPDWNVLEASNGDEALALSEDVDITCMTVDYNMPGIDGLQLCTQLQTRYSLARIAILTANIQKTLIQEVESEGFIFIHKPITESKISNYIQDL